MTAWKQITQWTSQLREGAAGVYGEARVEQAAPVDLKALHAKIGELALENVFLGLCPKNDESAGKSRSNRLKAGSPWLKTTLVQCAWAAARSKGTYLHTQYVRIRSRRGNKKAICAVAASILTAAYHMLKDGTFYEDPGPDYFDKRNKDQLANKLVNRLQNLGFNVTIQHAAA